MARVRPQPLTQTRPRKERHTANEADYFAYIASLPCCLTGGPAQVAHINMVAPNYGHMGRGKGEKAHYTWTLPMAPEPHHDMDNGDFGLFWKYRTAHWADGIVNLNPWNLCARLARIYLEYDDPARIQVATEVIELWRTGQ